MGMDKIWIDGKLIERKNARLSVFDHGTLYGDGVFEGIRVYNGKIFESKAHINRLFDSAKEIGLCIEYTRDQVEKAIIKTFKANGFKNCYIRLVVTRGVGDLGLSPNKCAKSCTFIIANGKEIFDKAQYEIGVTAIVSSVVRNHPKSINPNIKSLNYLNNILARNEADKAGAFEAIMLNHDGNIAEGTGDNIFIIKNGKIATPTVDCSILIGVTRKVILKLCKKLGIVCVERRIKPAELLKADECFLTGTAAEIIPVRKIDNKIIGKGKPGPITHRLIQAFHEYVDAR
jgi:branched-chain amino acid aminotransferase